MSYTTINTTLPPVFNSDIPDVQNLQIFMISYMMFHNLFAESKERHNGFSINIAKHLFEEAKVEKGREGVGDPEEDSDNDLDFDDIEKVLNMLNINDSLYSFLDLYIKIHNISLSDISLSENTNEHNDIKYTNEHNCRNEHSTIEDTDFDLKRRE